MVKMGSNVLQSRTRTSHKRVDPRYKEPSKPNLIIISSYLQVMKSHGSSWDYYDYKANKEPWRTYAKKIPDGLQEWYEDFLKANSIRSVSHETWGAFPLRHPNLNPDALTLEERRQWSDRVRKKGSVYDASHHRFAEHSVSNDVNNVFKTMLKLPKHVQDSITKAYDPDDYFRVKKAANTSKKLIG